MARRLLTGMLLLAIVTSVPASAATAAESEPLQQVQHIVVIYQENHSFDNLYGGWEGVNGLAAADAAHTTQIGQTGAPYTCLLQNDPNLTSPPLTANCRDTTTARPFSSHFRNAPFGIDGYIAPTANTCPHGGGSNPGGCTRDLVHHYYQEIYQHNNGAQNRYVTGSDAVGLVMGTYDTTQLPVYQYLHADGHPSYAVADNVFQAAFGGSFLNHQWLVAGATPVWPGTPPANAAVDHRRQRHARRLPAVPHRHRKARPAADAGLRPADDGGRGTPVRRVRDQHHPAALPADVARAAGPETAAAADGDHDRRRADRGRRQLGLVLGRLVERERRRRRPGLDERRHPPGPAPTRPGWQTPCIRTAPTACSSSITSRSTTTPASRRAPPSGPATCGTRPSSSTLATGSVDACNLPAVSFVKPIGAENEHPGYTGESRGSQHLVSC